MVAVDGLLTLSAAKEMRMALDRLGKPLHAGTSYDPHARTQAFHWRKGKLSALPIPKQRFHEWPTPLDLTGERT